MTDFYRQLDSEPGVSKADALQRAQLALLHGTGRDSAGGDRRGVALEDEGDDPNSRGSSPDPKAPYGHPYYWAPFILIGNWK